jgi:hypothetical protein
MAVKVDLSTFEGASFGLQERGRFEEHGAFLTSSFVLTPHGLFCSNEISASTHEHVLKAAEEDRPLIGH